MTLDWERDVVIRWDDGQKPEHVALLKEAGVTAVLTQSPPPAFAAACLHAGLRLASPKEIRFRSFSELPKTAGEGVVFQDGVWPGIGHPGKAADDAMVASASSQPWLDANASRIAWLRALCPGRPAVLGYLPDEAAGLRPDRLVPYDSLELALAEAWAFGGNYILSVEPRYRAALLAGGAQALAAWRQLGRTAAWLRQYGPVFRQRARPTVTLLADAGEASAEIANLCFRQLVSPAVERADAPPPPDPGHRLVIAAVRLQPVEPSRRTPILRHAEAGSIVVTDDSADRAWWRTPRLTLRRSERDRDFYALGKGQVVAYKDRISDPSEFAFDLIDLITHKRRPVRLWNAPAVIARVTQGAPHAAFPAGAALIAVNYGSPLGQDTLTRVQGVFRAAVLLRPDQPPLDLRVAKRGTTTEITIPELRRVGLVLFS